MARVSKWFSGNSGKSRSRKCLQTESLEDRRLMATLAGALELATVGDAAHYEVAKSTAIDLGYYPNPEDDDDFGPAGPVVKVERLAAHARLFSAFAHAEMSPVAAKRGSRGLGQPAPDDDGDWGPAGPLVHSELLRELAREQGQASIILGFHSDYYPAPDDDGDWGPAGPVVREILAAARFSLNDAGLPDDDLHPQEPSKWLRPIIINADQLGGTTAGTFSIVVLNIGQAGYPAPDDDGDWGPAGPVVRTF